MLELMNEYGKRNIPFLFVLDFELKRPIILPLSKAADQGIYFDIKGRQNFEATTPFPERIALRKQPISFQRYKRAFDAVQNSIRYGDSFLTNLTFPTTIQTNVSFRQIFEHSNAPYRLLFKDQFVTFSPESFIQIRNNQIASFPMKGTINATLPNAKQQLLADKKERAEHFTIVDLIRNDLNQVARKVRVERFQYIDHIKTAQGELLQASSEIVGELKEGWQSEIGTIFERLLPAGSICGAPKKRTVELIKAAEGYERGYYTGVFGYYENGVVESGVLIRFIEREGNQLLFKSGGGITASSVAEKEYQELIDKVYVPIHRKHSSPQRRIATLTLAHETL
ncbi:MAG: aminodeoxychorismate synthase component I [Bacteroidota bacterium]